MSEEAQRETMSTSNPEVPAVSGDGAISETVIEGEHDTLMPDVTVRDVSSTHLCFVFDSS